MDDKVPGGYDPEQYTPEAKRKRFIRVAEKRTNRILTDLRLLGNTSNKSLYKYEKADVDKIFDEIEKRMTEVRSRFNNGRESKQFRLD